MRRCGCGQYLGWQGPPHNKYLSGGLVGAGVGKPLWVAGKTKDGTGSGRGVGEGSSSPIGRH